MTKSDHEFYEGQRHAKCSHMMEPLNQSFIRRLKGRDETAATTFCDLLKAQMSTFTSFQTLFECLSNNHSTSTASLASSANYAQDASTLNQDPIGRSWEHQIICKQKKLKTLLNSDRAAAAVGNCTSKDAGLITDLDLSNVIDRSKLKREVRRCRKNTRREKRNSLSS